MMRILHVLAALVLGVSFADAGPVLTVQTPRAALYRGEEISLQISIKHDGDLSGGVIEASSDGLISASADVPATQTGQPSSVTLKIPTAGLKSNQQYPLAIVLKQDGQTLTSIEHNLALRRAPNPDRFEVWLWVTGGPVEPFYEQHGFTSAGGPQLPHTPIPGKSEAEIIEQAVRPGMEETMRRGIDASISPHAGLWERDFGLNPPTPDDGDIGYKGFARFSFDFGKEYKYKFYNPFHPKVAERQNHANELMMRAAADYPNLRYWFVGMEFVDDLYEANLNVGGLELMKRELGFTKDEIGEVKFIAPGVISDDDRAYAYHKYVYKKGNGTALICQRAAEVAKRIRPDVQVLGDPFRATALYDLYPGMDLIETWTYTNPDPKLMLYVDTLIAACKPANQTPLQVVTMLNYPGFIAPEEKGWLLMGPDRVKETSWIILSRALPIIGYYYAGENDPVKYKDDAWRVPPETSLAIKELSDKVYVPYGPMLRKLERSPRKIALLSSASSRVHGKSPALRGYPNEQILHFQSVLEMAHLNADVVFDETIERYGLDEYDVLVMPKCDVLTKTVYDNVKAFQKRGGVLIADQYLGPRFDNVLRFNFDFTYRHKVSADAILKNKSYAGAGSDDHIKPGTSEMVETTGVTAEDDQLIMESYAKELRERLAGKVDPDVWAEQTNVLFAQAEKHGVRYLYVINDKRQYCDRVGQYKAIMEDLVPQDVTVHMKRPAGAVFAYDLLQRKELPIVEDDHGVKFDVSLDELGGKIIALYPARLAALKLEVPATIETGKTDKIRLTVKNANDQPSPGLQPVRVQILDPGGNDSEYTDYFVAENGVLEINFQPAINDPKGQWTVKTLDLTAGLVADVTVEVK